MPDDQLSGIVELAGDGRHGLYRFGVVNPGVSTSPSDLLDVLGRRGNTTIMMRLA
ncbi:MAG: hypothetical protein OEU26_31675 [Candidatus Tectomicrobia bacterium]|nr:hypothetical protein [Candidatus Tectomicrobia bacterium]